MEGDCCFPFVEKSGKYSVTHKKCVDGPKGKWCATSRKKKNQWKTKGYCEPSSKKYLEKLKKVFHVYFHSKKRGSSYGLF